MSSIFVKPTIDKLMDAEYFEEAIFLTESGLRLMEVHFGGNLVEKTYWLVT